MGEGDVLQEAHSLIEQAEAATKPKKWLFFSTSPDYVEAAELYNRAGIIFKGAKQWQDAGNAFRLSAAMDSKAGEPDELSRKLLAAASCYKKCNVRLAVETIEEALVVLLRTGRFQMAAAHEKEIAELYESQLDDPENAVIYYKRAAERYAGEDSESIAQSCSLKAARLLALLGDHEKAAQIYEEAASACASDSVRKYSVRDFLFRAGICRLCSEERIAARRALEEYPNIDMAFESTKEYNLLAEIQQALETENLEAFTEAVTAFDRTNPLDDWKTKMLLKVKEGMSGEKDLT